LTERLRKIKEEPLINERIPHPYREIVRELRGIRELLEEVKERLVAPPPVAPPPVVAPPALPPLVVPPAPPEWMPVTDRLDRIAVELGVTSRHLSEVKARLLPLLLRANTYRVETLDLGTARDKAELALEGFALTVFKSEGTIKLRFNARSEDEVTIEELTFPEMVVFDWLEFNKVFVTNTVQSGKEAILIALWRK